MTLLTPKEIIADLVPGTRVQHLPTGETGRVIKPPVINHDQILVAFDTSEKLESVDVWCYPPHLERLESEIQLVGSGQVVHVLTARYRAPGDFIVGVYNTQEKALAAQYHAERVKNWAGFTWSISEFEIDKMP